MLFDERCGGCFRPTAPNNDPNIVNTSLRFPKILRYVSASRPVAGATLLLAMAVTVPGEALRTERIPVRAGWNAVFLSVHPVDPDPEAVFASTPADIVASYYTADSSAQFMTDPGVNFFRQTGWGVWYAENRPDAFLRSLHAIFGQRAYLIHARADFTWEIAGTVLPPEIRWQSDAYNLVGFTLPAQGAPTFAQFFANSQAHRSGPIFRLVGGTWQRVSDPAAAPMRSGEAFWIYCRGASDYQGPLRVRTTTSRGLVLGGASDSLLLRNETDHPLTPTLEHIVSGPNPVPLSLVIQAVGTPVGPVQSVSVPQPPQNWSQTLPPLEAGAALRVPLAARREDMGSFRHSSLLKVSTDLGTEVWIPVLGIREDLQSR